MIELSLDQKKNIGFEHVISLLQPVSVFGREALRGLRPFLPGEEEALFRQFDNIETTCALLPELDQEYTRLEHTLSQLRDARGSIGRLGTDLISDIDLFELKSLLLRLTEVRSIFLEINRRACYKGIFFPDTGDALPLLDPEERGVATFRISSRYSPRLASLRREKLALEQQLRRCLCEEEKTALLSRRDRTVLGEQEEEQAVCLELSKKIKPYAADMLRCISMVAELDLTIRKARLALVYGCCKPVPAKDSIRFENMTNPLIAEHLSAKGLCFTPLSLTLHCGTTVITGANMGGKSVTLNTIALNVMLVHCGIYPFAAFASCPVFHNIHLVSEELEDAARSVSSFAGEALRLRQVLEDIPSGLSLALFDELARGTNPHEGAAIARGIAEHLNGCHAISVLTTHFDGVSEVAGIHYQAAGLQNVDLPALAEKIKNTPLCDRAALISAHIDYGLIPLTQESPPPRDAINICRLLGLDGGIMDKIEQYLEKNPQ